MSRKISAKIVCFFLAALMICASFAMFATGAASAVPTVAVIENGQITNAVWNYGYVGSATNTQNYAYKIYTSSLNASYAIRTF